MSPDTVRASLERARVASDFTPGAFDPFAERLPRLLDPSERLSYDGYVAHGLGDLLDRFIVRDARPLDAGDLRVSRPAPSRPPACRAIVDAVDPAQTFTGLTLVNRELARQFLPQFLKGLAIGTVIVVALVVAAFRDWRLSTVCAGCRRRSG